MKGYGAINEYIYNKEQTFGTNENIKAYSR